MNQKKMNQRTIHVLPDHLANQIAAGEVIQRPESVVKELLENSLDAGATSITVIIKEAGKKLIQVVDDGIGMNEQDAVASFLRHATSKISSLDDLEAIATYGFRGEALASIAAVAHVTMKTRREEDDAAVVVQIESDGKPIVSREGREWGTSIAVQNLFYNVPARRKFLKTNATEFRHISDAVQRIALSHPDVALRFISDDETLLDLRPGDMHARVIDVFGQRQVEGMVWTEEASQYVSLSGYIGKPTFGQKSRANQYLFLNKRYITNKNIAHAVYTAYENLLIKGTFPFFLLFLEIDPRRIDVNVHPSKMEAKFEDEQAIYRFVSSVVRRTLSTNDLVPAMSARSEGGDPGSIGFQFTNRQHSWSGEVVDRSTGEIVTGRREQYDRQSSGGEFRRTVSGSAAVEKLFAPVSSTHQSDDVRELAASEGLLDSLLRSDTRIWQLHNKYILMPIESGMLIVDQHVAHERVLYERIVHRFERGTTASQQLLFPQTLELTPGDFVLANELAEHFARIGFTIKPFGRNTIVVEGIPADVRREDEAKIVEDVLSLYREYQQHGMIDARDTLAKSFSCKAAVKAGDPLQVEAMRSLLDQLFQTKIPYVCPHGRPVLLKISIEELDRRFGRT